MTTDTSVKYFDSTMSGHSVLSNTAGSLNAVLLDCLVNGFGEVAITSLDVVDNIATVVTATNHGFALKGQTGPVILIEGVTSNLTLNQEWRIQTVPNSTTLTFFTTGMTNHSAIGDMTVKRAPAGLTRVFNESYKSAYQFNAFLSQQMCFRVDDTGTSSARIRGYETMQSVDNGTGLFPTDAQQNGGLYVFKYYPPGTEVHWKLISDGRMIYFFNTANQGIWGTGGFFFGEINSYIPSDGFSTLVLGSTANDAIAPFSGFNVSGSTSGQYTARAANQSGGSILGTKYSHGATPAAMCTGGQAYSPGNLHMWPVEVWDGVDSARGLMPGFWNPVHDGDVPHDLIVENVLGLPGRTFYVQDLGLLPSAVIDITGPWR